MINDDWETPTALYRSLDRECKFDFDPCPLFSDFDGLSNDVEWGKMNYVNPPYNEELKEAFVERCVKEMENGNSSVILLPVSTSTNLFQDVILPNATCIDLVRKRIPFVGVDLRNRCVNWHLGTEWPKKGDNGRKHIRQNGQRDNMLVYMLHNDCNINLVTSKGFSKYIPKKAYIVAHPLHNDTI